MSPALEQQPDGDGLQARVLLGIFAQRTVSIVAFLLTVLVFPFIAIPVVGVAGFGALMGLGPLAAIATGPLNGLLARKLSARDAMAVNTVVRAALALMMPALSLAGVLNFWTLLVASVAHGWLLSSIMTTENIYIRRFSGRHLGSINALAMINFLAVQVVLGLIVGVGRYVGEWDPMVPYYISAAAHAFIVLPLVWNTIPDVIDGALAAPGTIRSGKRVRFAAFLGSYAKEAILFGAGLAAVPLLQTTIPAGCALLYWISRTEDFRALWATRHLRHAVLLYSLAVAIFYPFQTFCLPILAQTLAGSEGKALLLGKLLGALYFGQLISSASQTRLPVVSLPLFGPIGAHHLVQGGVLALLAVWAYVDLFPGNIVASALSLAVGAALMVASGELTARGWIQLLGVGLSATLLPLLDPTNVPLLFGSLLLRGLVCGPALVALTTYFFSRLPRTGAESMIGIQGSLYNAAMSLGYGALGLFTGLAEPLLPGILWQTGIVFVLAGLIFALAPLLMPGLPETWLYRRMKVHKQ